MMRTMRTAGLAAAVAAIAACCVGGATALARQARHDTAGQARADTTRPSDCSTTWPYAIYQGNAVNLYASKHRCFYYSSGPSGWITFQTNGNLVVYGAGNIVWQTHTAGQGYRFSILGNGDFVVYTKRGKIAWQNHANRIAPHRKGLGYWLGLDANARGTAITGASEGISVPGSESGSMIWSSDNGFTN